MPAAGSAAALGVTAGEFTPPPARLLFLPIRPVARSLARSVFFLPLDLRLANAPQDLKMGEEGSGASSLAAPPALHYRAPLVETLTPSEWIPRATPVIEIDLIYLFKHYCRSTQKQQKQNASETARCVRRTRY